MALEGSYLAAKRSEDYIFSWNQTGGGLDPIESHLHFLIEEGGVVQIRREEKGGREFCQWYRFKPWLFDYLKRKPELRTLPEK